MNASNVMAILTLFILESVFVMRAVVQRVTHAQVDVLTTTSRHTAGQIQQGLMVLLGVADEDTETDARYIADKITHLRIFTDTQDKMNLSVKDVGGKVLLVSQFTLYGDTRNGRRPSYTQAARPEKAIQLYDCVAKLLQNNDLNVATGEFQTHMQVSLCNDGPVTLLLDSHKQF